MQDIIAYLFDTLSGIVTTVEMTTYIAALCLVTTYCLYYAGVQIHYLEEEYTEIDRIFIGYRDAVPRRITSVILNISGKGCRTIESLNPGFDWFEFFYQFNDMILAKDVHFARLDLACDDTDGILDMKQIIRYTERYQFVCKSKCLPMTVGMREEAAYFGSPKSDRRLRIYNKALEQGIDATIETLKQLHLPGNEYSYEVLCRYIRQTHSSVKTYLKLTHGDVGAYLDQVDKSEQSVKQVELVHALLQQDRETK